MTLGQDIELSDLEQQDYAFYKSMLWLKENPIEKGDYTFSYLYDNFGQRIVKDLIVDGRNIDVTEENKTGSFFSDFRIHWKVLFGQNERRLQNSNGKIPRRFPWNDSSWVHQLFRSQRTLTPHFWTPINQFRRSQKQRWLLRLRANWSGSKMVLGNHRRIRSRRPCKIDPVHYRNIQNSSGRFCKHQGYERTTENFDS